MARGSFHTSRRRSHELPSSSCGMGHSTVRSSSAITMSSSVPKFDCWRSSRDVAHDPAAQRLVLGGVHVAEAVVAEVGEATEHARLGRLRQLEHLEPDLGVAQALDALGHRRAEDVAPPGDEPDPAEVEEAHVHRHLHRHGERDQAATELGGAVTGRELARHALGLARVDGEHVPVERAVGRRAHLRRAARSRRRRTGRGSPARCPRAWCPGAAPVSSLIAMSSSGVAQRLATGWPSPSLCDDDCVNEKPSAPAVERLAELGAHLGDLLGGGLAADGVGAHHVATDRAVTGEEAGVHRDGALELVEELAERLPLPVDALLERGEGHALDPAPSSGAGSRRRRPAAARARTRSCRRRRW